MLPLLAETVTYQNVLPVYSLDGMTLLIGTFFFWCLAKPSRVKNRSQFWAVFAVLLLITLLYSLRAMLYNTPAAQVFCGVCIGVLQAAGLVLTVMYVGGLRAGEIAEELRDAADDFRRGGEPAKPTIVPLTGEKPVPRDEPVAPPRIVINLPKDPPDGRMPVE